MKSALQPVDLALVGAYFVFLLLVGLRFFGVARRDATEYLLMGRKLALPSFVATLVTTWYGGILGVGEFSYRFGISNWLVFGVPYLIAKRARRSRLYTVPDQLAAAYGRPAGLLGAVVIQILSSPAPYVLMLGVLLQTMFGGPLWVAILVGTVVSTGYSLRGGLRSVVRADNVQFILMYLGFLIALPLLALRYGGLDFLRAHLPATHFVWHGGNAPQYVFVWYLIALQTLVEPTFYQRAFAAVDERVAQRGVLISIGFWMIFDFLTTFTGLYARALMPQLADPVRAYPALAVEFLPPVLRGLFYLGLLATVMSTVDGYTFIGGVNFGRDLIWRWRQEADESRVNRYVQVGFLITAILALALALFFRSAVDLWHDVGSVGVPALLVPLLSSYSDRWRMSPRAAVIAIVAGGGVSLAWLLWRNFGGASAYPLGLEPIYPGLAVSALIWALRIRPATGNLPAKPVI
ncbi:MAG: sodium:solute symporter family protein [Candidatus Eisenbacteria bacterium]|uniref:Sodium:solute symporter family protein n=1 Tax=Eiseniibacteriota bacterium TaxID=2212470 RepID=A0A538TGW8_UNCEI|nr:MAG: sodium:solute symporter family protein [Candidatus Eisenbacteria bacterium]